MKISIVWLFFINLALLSTGCVVHQGQVVQSSFRSIGPPTDPRISSCEVDIFRTTSSSKKHRKVSRIDVHMESVESHYPRFSEIFPELSRQACESGADAVIDFRERESNLSGGIHTYHVTATGIRYE